jgi:DNA-binding NarL/FixJ family response regulator
MKSALILEDTADVRRWLANLLATAFPAVAITEAGSLTQARQAAASRTFDLALIDISLPDGSGITLLEELRRGAPQTFCVMATILDDDENVFRALRSGAQGYLLKDDPEEKLVASLEGILRGEPPLSPSVARRMLGYFRNIEPEANDARLTDREREVLTLVAKGLSRAEIAGALSVGITTVASHIGAVYRKLDISSRPEATVEAIRMGLIRT